MSSLSPASERPAEGQSLTEEIDALLDADQRDATTTPPGRLAYGSVLRLGALVLLVVSSTAAAQTLPPAALQHRIAVTALPLAHFAILSLSLAAFSNLTRWGQKPSNNDGTLAPSVYVGVLSALSFSLNTWQATWLEAKTWAALEIFIIPFLVLLPPLLHLRSAPSRTPTLHYVAISITFLVGFALLGVHSSRVGIIIALLRLPIEAARWLLIRQSASADGFARFLLIASLSALAASLLPFIATLIFPAPDSSIPFSRSEFAVHIRYSVAVLANQISLVASLSLLAAPLTTAATLLTRNLALIVIGPLGRYGRGIRGGWVQVLCVYVGGALAMAWVDPEITEIVRGSGRLAQAIKKHSVEEGFHYSPPTSPRTIAPSPRPGNVPSPDSSAPWSFSVLPFLPLLAYLIMSTSVSTSIGSACSFLPVNVASTLCYSLAPAQSSRTVDLVFSYHEEDLVEFKRHIDNIRWIGFIAVRKSRVLVYNKGSKSELTLRKELELRKSDEVIKLENVGREGATYLHHILSHYNSSIDALASALLPSLERPSHKTTVLADHTYFLQPHLAWHWVAQNRLGEIATDTGFANFGPYLVNDCGKDSDGPEFALVRDIFEIFTGELCAPGGQLSAWSGQFVVSKRRILQNAYRRYEALNDLLVAPADHWIHQQVWGPNGSGGPSNPGFGHYVERAWPVMFGCRDPKMAERCGEKEYRKEICQCLD